MAGKSSIGVMIMIFLSFSFLGGCGDSQSNNGGQKNSGQGNGNGGFAAGEIQTWVEYDQNGDTLLFTFHLKNQTESVETYHFSTGQRFDFIIKNNQDEKVTQYSEGRMFTQALGTEKMKQAEELTYKTKVTGLAEGEYTVTFWLTAKEEQPKASLTFTVK
ncbi:MAG TPA: BsuPI-related putative proteinase inhibitor [Bacillales bacterium]|nr:BsuPI-related putative proteinase inhibitor [Bacillales bacterium]